MEKEQGRGLAVTVRVHAEYCDENCQERLEAAGRVLRTAYLRREREGRRETAWSNTPNT